MNLLAIESSSKNLTVGLSLDNKILKLSSSKIYDTANALPLLTKKILKDNSMKPTDIDAICLSIGPGSFTSLRVGISYAKGLSIGLIPLNFPQPMPRVYFVFCILDVETKYSLVK